MKIPSIMAAAGIFPDFKWKKSVITEPNNENTPCHTVAVPKWRDSDCIHIDASITNFNELHITNLKPHFT